MAIDAVMSRITEIRSAMGATAASVAPGAVGGVMGGNTMATAMVSADTTRTTVTNPTQDFDRFSAAVATSSIAPAASTAAAQSLTPAGTHTDRDLGQRIVNEARTWIGTPTNGAATRKPVWIVLAWSRTCCLSMELICLVLPDSKWVKDVR